MDTRLFLFDDARARSWDPFASTRPIGELRFGALLLRERVERVAGMPCTAHLAGAELSGWDESGAPAVGSLSGPTVDGMHLLWSSRAVPDLAASLPRQGPATFTVGGSVAGWCLPAGAPLPTEEALLDPDSLVVGDTVELEGEWLAWPWHLVERNAARLGADLAELHGADDAGELAGVERIGSHTLSLADGASVGPGVVIDTRAGSVRLDEATTVDGPARLTGPLHLGAGCSVFGGHLSRASVGPGCKLRGEVDTAVLLGFANKAHDGYLGHALVGRWVNLGAMTTNSDLKNNYRPVRMELSHGSEDTGLLKVGAFLADHVKTGIGTLLTTGAVIGVGSNVFGGGVIPKRVPAFSWGSADGSEPYRLDAFLEVARAAMGRRGHELTPGVAAVLTGVWDRTHAHR